jgi:predicted nucleic acid-binding protein
MIRVIVDTNILVSALLQPQGVPARTVLISLGSPRSFASAAISMPNTKKCFGVPSLTAARR